MWEGRWDVTRGRSVNEIVQNYPHVSETIAKLSCMYRFSVASFDTEPRIRKRIEAAIARHLNDQEGAIGSFQDNGIWYRPRTDAEEPIRVKIVCPSSCSLQTPLLHYPVTRAAFANLGASARQVIRVSSPPKGASQGKISQELDNRRSSRPRLEPTMHGH